MTEFKVIYYNQGNKNKEWVEISALSKGLARIEFNKTHPNCLILNLEG
jgi:hypothetical protein